MKYGYVLLLLACTYVNSKKILFVTGQFPAITETFILNQITELIDRGHEVYIYANQEGETSKIHDDVEKYDLISKTFYSLPPQSLGTFDFVCCQFGYFGLSTVRKFHKLTKHIFICLRGTDITTFVKQRPKFYKRLFSYVANHAQAKVTYLPVCNYFKKLLKELGCPEKNIIIQPSAIDCTDIVYQEKKYSFFDPVKILSVGRLVEKKGRDDLLRAFALVIKKYPFAHLTIVGDGPKKKNIERLIKKLGLEKSVTLYGWASKEEIKKLLYEHHIFVLSSKTAKNGNKEGIPNALKEAMAAGLPVVSTKHSGIPELIEHGETGFLAPQRGHQQLAEYMIYLIRYPEKWSEMTIKARQFVENNFDLKAVIDKLESLFEQYC